MNLIPKETIIIENCIEKAESRNILLAQQGYIWLNFW